MTHLIDLSALPCGCANHGLESLHKALSESPPDIWRPHENPYLAETCEAFTLAGQSRLLDAQDALLAVLGLPGGSVLAKADLSPAQVTAAVARLQKPLHTYGPDDWVALVDLILQSHLVPADLRTAVDTLAWRAQLAGKLDAAHAADPSLGPHEALLQLILQANPTRRVKLPTLLARAWDWAKASVGVKIVQLTDNLRARIAGAILGHVEANGPHDWGKLQQTLFDQFGAANRDWRRIAITEAGEIANHAYLGQFPDGTPMERVEMYDSACPFCRSLHGRTFLWSTKPLPDEYGWTHIWPGKSNVGRSASPRKQTPEGLVARTESELWWPAAGLQHPHCRGRWLARPEPEMPADADPEFVAWAKQRLRDTRPL